MEAPKELFLHPNHKDEVGANWLTFPLTDSDVKYIRADLAELTWVHIWKIWDIIEQVKNDFCDNPKIFKLKEVTPEYFKQAYGEEVLRRFNKYRQNAREARSGTRKGKGI